MSTFSLLVACGLLAAPPSSPPGLDPADLAAYEEIQAQTPSDADAQVRLALWCEARGLTAERLKHLALAVLKDPSHAAARGLMGLVAYQGRWKRPEAVADAVKADEALAAKLAEYNGRRDRAEGSADAQWKLALWCEENGLDAEAKAHLTMVVRLEPGREAAWKRLGCKKVNGRWMTTEAIASAKREREAQEAADKLWTPPLTRWRRDLRSKDEAKRAEAERRLSEVSDPLAVPAVWSVFVKGTNQDAARAVQLLGQIDTTGASKALAYLSVYHDDAEVRRSATETLRRRDPREFAGLLVELIQDPIKFEVKPVAGPGSVGELVVNGKRASFKRVYSAPGTPLVPLRFGDRVLVDQDGLPVITRNLGEVTDSVPASRILYAIPNDPLTAAIRSDLLNTPPRSTTRIQVSSQRTLRIPVGRMAVESHRVAATARQQLEDDARTLRDYNESLREGNERVLGVLREVSSKDMGPDSQAWSAWLTDQLGYVQMPRRFSQDRPVLVENVPIGYVPPPISPTIVDTLISYRRMSCFGGGTLVRTLEGPRPIETLKVGDRVLTQDVKDGALGYHPITFVHHNPPSPTFLVKVKGDTIVSSPFHRFWVVGKGWVMARDLNGGETLRLLDGPATVESVSEGPVQPVFNLDVAEAHDFFAGAASALVHDNTLPDTRLRPFDAVTEVVSAGR